MSGKEKEKDQTKKRHDNNTTIPEELDKGGHVDIEPSINP